MKRPYGVSPFAAPAGIAPVELSMPQPVAHKPMVIHNPHFKGNALIDAEKMKADAEMKADTKVNVADKVKKNKVTGWQANPFFYGRLASN